MLDLLSEQIFVVLFSKSNCRNSFDLHFYLHRKTVQYVFTPKCVYLFIIFFAGSCFLQSEPIIQLRSLSCLMKMRMMRSVYLSLQLHLNSAKHLWVISDSDLHYHLEKPQRNGKILRKIVKVCQNMLKNLDKRHIKSSKSHFISFFFVVSLYRTKYPLQYSWEMSKKQQGIRIHEM